MSIRPSRIAMFLSLVALALFFGRHLRFTPHATAATRELAGEYYCGDGLGANLTLSLHANGSFDYTWHGCLGLYDQNEGTYELVGDTLVFHKELPNRRDGSFAMDTKLIPVRWGGRRYLVRRDEMQQFCSKVSDGHEPRTAPHGFPYLRSGDEAKPVQGLPAVPAKYASLLRGSGVIARVTRVTDEWNVTIDAGSNAGIHVGDAVYVGTFSPPFRVVLVRANSSELDPDDASSLPPNPAPEREALRGGDMVKLPALLKNYNQARRLHLPTGP